MLLRACASASIVVSLAMLNVTVAAAAGQRSFVSGSGADVNTCTLIAPCRSFGYAITQTNSGGEVIVLDSAGYGPVTINRAVSITAPAGVYAGISVFSGNGVTIDAPGASVTLRGLTIVGVGGGDFGIYAIAVGGLPTVVGVLRIEHCTVKGMTGIGVVANPLSLVILDSTFEENGMDGIQGNAFSGVLIERTRSTHNGQNGIRLGASAVIRDSTFAYNAAEGIYAPNSQLSLENSEVTHNIRGVNAINTFGVAVSLSISRSNISYNTMEGVNMMSTFATPLPLPHGSITDTVIHHNGTYGIYAPEGQMIVSNVTVTSNGSYGLCGGSNNFTRTNNTVFDNNGGGVQVCGPSLVPLPPV